MKSFVSPTIRTLLVQSLPRVKHLEDRIRGAMSTALTRSAHDPELSDTPDVVATLLLRFLIDQAEHVVEDGEPSNLHLHLAEHRLNGVVGRHYSRFGDSLVPVLRDALGPTHPFEMAAAWCDVFWGVVQRMQQGERHHGSTGIVERVADPIA